MTDLFDLATSLSKAHIALAASRHLQASAATEAGGEVAQIVVDTLPRWRTDKQINAHMVEMGCLAHWRDDAESDPAAFVKAFFDYVDREISDVAYDVRNQ